MEPADTRAPVPECYKGAIAASQTRMNCSKSIQLTTTMSPGEGGGGCQWSKHSAPIQGNWVGLLSILIHGLWLHTYHMLLPTLTNMRMARMITGGRNKPCPDAGNEAVRRVCGRGTRLQIQQGGTVRAHRGQAAGCFNIVSQRLLIRATLGGKR